MCQRVCLREESGLRLAMVPDLGGAVEDGTGGLGPGRSSKKIHRKPTGKMGGKNDTSRGRDGRQYQQGGMILGPLDIPPSTQTLNKNIFGVNFLIKA